MVSSVEGANILRPVVQHKDSTYLPYLLCLWICFWVETKKFYLLEKIFPIVKKNFVIHDLEIKYKNLWQNSTHDWWILLSTSHHWFRLATKICKQSLLDNCSSTFMSNCPKCLKVRLQILHKNLWKSNRCFKNIFSMAIAGN